MSIQSDALLTLADGYVQIEVDQRMLFEGRLWSNPIIAHPAVYDLAVAEAEGNEANVLQLMVDKGLLVISENPEAKRVELANTRPGYENRANRRAARRAAKRGKSK